MGVIRREFLTISGAVGTGLAPSSLGIALGPLNAYAEEVQKVDKLKTARQSFQPAAPVRSGAVIFQTTVANEHRLALWGIQRLVPA